MSHIDKLETWRNADQANREYVIERGACGFYVQLFDVKRRSALTLGQASRLRDAVVDALTQFVSLTKESNR